MLSFTHTHTLPARGRGILGAYKSSWGSRKKKYPEQQTHILELASSLH